MTQDVTLAGYVFLLVQLRKSAEMQSATVRYLPTPAEGVDPALILRRSATN